MLESSSLPTKKDALVSRVARLNASRTVHGVLDALSMFAGR